MMYHIIMIVSSVALIFFFHKSIFELSTLISFSSCTSSYKTFENWWIKGKQQPTNIGYSIQARGNTIINKNLRLALVISDLIDFLSFPQFQSNLFPRLKNFPRFKWIQRWPASTTFFVKVAWREPSMREVASSVLSEAMFGSMKW